MSRIYYDGKYFDYPLKAAQRPAQPRPRRGRALRRCPTSGPGSARRRTRPTTRAGSAARFGWRLYRTFFKTYTEKVWGVPASEMPADWAAQRIKNLSLCNAVDQRAAARSGTRRTSPRLIEEFQYPKYGPGMMWEVCRDKVEAPGLEGRHGDPRSPPIRHADGRATVGDRSSHDGGEHASTRAPTSSRRCRSRSCSQAMDPPAPAEVQAAADGLRLPRLPHRRPGRARERRLPRQLDLHPRPRGAGRPDPELRLVVAVPGEGRAHLPRPRVLRVRGRRPVERRRRRPHRARQAGARASSAWSRPADVEAGYVVRMPKAYPIYDEHLPGQRRDDAARGSRPTRPTSIPSAATACTGTTTRTTRCTRPC